MYTSFFFGNDNSYIIYSILIYKKGEPKETCVSETSRYANLTRSRGCYGTFLGFFLLQVRFELPTYSPRRDLSPSLAQWLFMCPKLASGGGSLEYLSAPSASEASGNLISMAICREKETQLKNVVTIDSVFHLMYSSLKLRNGSDSSYLYMIVKSAT